MTLATLTWIMRGAAACAILAIAVPIAQYILWPGYLDHVEVNQVIQSWRMLSDATSGANDGYPTFVQVYGPAHLLIHSAFLSVLGGSIAASKLVSAVAALGGLALFLAMIARPVGGWAAAAAVCLMAAIMARLLPFTILARPDAMELLLVTASLALARLAPPIAYSVGMGICLGLLANLKIHAFLYAVPVLIWRWPEARTHWFMLAAAMVLAFLSPFLHPNVSVLEYIRQISLHSGRSLDFSAVPTVAAFAGLLLVPPALAWAATRGNLREIRSERYFIAMIAAMLAIGPAAVFPGAGPYHLLPFAPVSAHLLLIFAARINDPGKAFLASAAVVSVLAAAAVQPISLLKNMQRIDAHAIAIDIATALRLTRGEPLQMGYGEAKATYHLSWFRPHLDFAGQASLVDAQGLMEYHRSGFDLQDRWAEDISSCRWRHWLIPRGETPFALKRVYSGDTRIFGSTSQEAFRTSYAPTTDIGHFTLWTCKRT